MARIQDLHSVPPTSGGVGVGSGDEPASRFDCNQELQMHLQMHILVLLKIETRKPNPNTNPNLS